MVQYIFLDESGDLGFNPKKKNSKFFIVTILFTSDKQTIERTVKKIHQSLRKKVKKLSGGILHAYKEKPHIRRKLLTLLGIRDCKVMAIILNKSKVYTRLQNEKHLLYNYVTNILLDRIIRKKTINTNLPVIMVAAKRETNKFLNLNFKKYLENEVKNRHKLDMRVEIKVPGQEKTLQAVDFVSWAFFRKYESGDVEYYNILKERKKIIEENQLYP